MPRGEHLFQVDSEDCSDYIGVLERCLAYRVPPIGIELALAVHSNQVEVRGGEYYWRGATPCRFYGLYVMRVWWSGYSSSYSGFLRDILNLELCQECDNYFDYGELEDINGETVCEHCRYLYSWCERCESYYRGKECGDCGCQCESAHKHFSFPANGMGTVRQNQAFDVSLPASGTISETGLSKIAHYMIDRAQDFRYADTKDVAPMYDYLYSLIRIAQSEIGPQWQTKRGNYNRRISSALYKKNIVTPQSELSEIGNIARTYADAETVTLNVAFTRELNESADYFYHSESCWFTDYARKSRCALKSWGGLAMRTLNADGEPTGRAWIQPLDDNNNPTSDTIGAASYLVYNCYGELENYVAATIVAHLTGRTYKKIDYLSALMYINGNMAYLVSTQEICDHTNCISHSRYAIHDRF